MDNNQDSNKNLKFIKIGISHGQENRYKRVSDISQDFERAYKFQPYFEVVLVITIVAVVFILIGFINHTYLLSVISFFCFLISGYLLPQMHKRDKKSPISLKYLMQNEIAFSYRNIQDSFTALTSCGYVSLVKLAPNVQSFPVVAIPSFNLPKYVSCNLMIPVVKSAYYTICFFPDRLFYCDSFGVRSVPYQELQVYPGEVTRHGFFRVPPDAMIVGK